ncbi:MAG: nucleotidyltransferase [Bifidobacteriaceae bacterium]|jgi:predicted nucleotidyltransferase|nr:nucleotidyltransferase [Bifidobacteriaceae bacterium]
MPVGAVTPGAVRPSQVLAERREAVVAAVRARGLANPRVFGSVARGADAPGGDLDLMVSVPVGAALGFLGLADELAALLGIRVDVVSDRALKGGYAEALDEAVPL